MSDINFWCGRCGQAIVADSRAAGLQADCPNCLEPLTIPGGEVDDMLGFDEMAELEGGLSGGGYPEPGRGWDGAEGFSDLDGAECFERRPGPWTRLREQIKGLEIQRDRLSLLVAASRAETCRAQAELRELRVRLWSGKGKSPSIVGGGVPPIDVVGGNALPNEALGWRDLPWHERLSHEAASKAAEEGDLEYWWARTQVAELLVQELRADVMGLTANLVRAGEARLAAELERDQANAVVAELARWITAAGCFQTPVDAAADETRPDQPAVAPTMAAGELAGEPVAEPVDKPLAEPVAESAEARSSAELLAADNEVLRGIISRQNTELTGLLKELRRLKEGRFVLHILYTLIALALAGLAWLGVEWLLEFLA